MLMKYKDFKMMSQNEMKKIMGGSEEFNICATVCPDGGYAWLCDGSLDPYVHSGYQCTQTAGTPGESCHLLATCVIP